MARKRSSHRENELLTTADKDALPDREAQYRSLTGQWSVGVIIIQARRVRYINPALTQILGHSEAEVLEASSVLEFVVDDDRALFQENLRVLEEGTTPTISCTVRARTKGGAVLDLEVIGSCVSFEGRPAVMSVVVDGTQRKQAEATIRADEERHRAFVESMGDVLVVIDQESRIIDFANAVVEEVFGYSPAELLGKEVTVLMPERFRDPHRSGVRRYLETRTKHLNWKGTSVLGLHKTGKEIPLEVSYSEYVHGQRRYFVGVMRDVTSQRETEEALRLFRTLLDRSNDAVEIIDLQTGRFLDVNERVCLNLGYTREEILALRIWDVHTKLDPGRLDEIEAQLRDAGALRWEGVNRRKDGSAFPVEVGMSLIRVDQREYVVAIVRDITERRRLEAQFLQAQKMESLGQLAAGVAHDFNNLLTVINGISEVALDGMEGDHPLRADLEDILHAGENAASLTRQLLAFSRKQIIEPKVMDPNAVVAKMQGMIQRLIGKSIHVVFVPGNDVNAVLADPGQIEQVLINLAINARDAMPDGGLLTIETRSVGLDGPHAEAHPSVVPGPHVLLAVTDTGTGMDEATRERLFEPYFTSKDIGKGTGLGLATVYGIVKQSQGSIWVYSELGKGTTFKIYLPQVQEAPDNVRSPKAAAANPATETILVVEDDEAVRRMAVRILRAAGYTVLSVRNGEDALRSFEQQSGELHLIFTDVVMPGIDGRALSKQLEQVSSRAKFLFTSGYTDEAIVHHGVLEKGIHFITKPYTAEQLTRKVREVLDS